MFKSDLSEKTLQRAIAISGTGLFTGEKVSLVFCPAPPGTGIVFQRMDLVGKPKIPAQIEYVKQWPRCTMLAAGKATVQMIEHLMSALSAYGIDNLRIEVTGSEIPACDGSANSFVQAIEEAGIQTQISKKRFLKIEQPIFWSEGEVHLVALPADHFRLSYSLYYPKSAALGSQFYSFFMDAERYKQEIAPCRTFSLYEEIAPFIEKGLLKGGGLDNALVIKGDRIMNPEGARFPDEMVRHKVLDLIGDLALIGAPLLGHVIAIRSGHSSNLAFAKKILAACQPQEEAAYVESR